MRAGDGASARSALIVAGGTGGHIFPALVFGRWLEAHCGAAVSYLSGSRPLEAEIYAAAGVTPFRLSLEGSPLGVRSPLKVLRRSLALVSAFGEVSRRLAEVRPTTAFLFGGYVSFAPLLLCRLRGIPVVFHEQNAVAGRVTRLASRLGAVIASGWEECLGLHGPHVLTGVPVRTPHRLPRAEAERRLGLSLKEGSRVVGVISGSLGSAALVREALRAADALGGRAEPVEFVLLGDAPGEADREGIHFVGRRWDVDPLYSLCDALICRAGASTLAEALRWGIPAAAVPWMQAADGHQVRNALSFAEAGGGVLWKEGDTLLLADVIGDLLERGRAAAPADGDAASMAIARAAGLL